MNFIQRMQTAWQVLTEQRPKKEPRRASVPALWPEYRNGQVEWRQTDIGSYIAEGFNANPVIYSGVMFKALTAVSAPLRAYRGDPGSPELLPDTDELQKLCANPNQRQTEAVFKMLNMCYMDLAGENFIYLNRTSANAFPKSMLTLRPDWVTILAGKDNAILGYYYRPESWPAKEGLPILPSDMLHWKFPNPGDPLGGFGHGLSPMAPLARAADVDNSITTFLKKFFDSGSMIDTLLTFDIDLEDEDIRRIRQRWQEIYGGVENWSEVGVLGSGGKAQKLGYSFEQMGFETLDERGETRMLSSLGVSPILTGARVGLKHSTYSNYEQALDACNQQRILPTLQMFSDGYNSALAQGGKFVRYDTAAMPGMAKNVPQLVDAAHKLWSMGYPANDATAFVGLDIPPAPTGATSFLPSGVVPAAATPEPTAQAPTSGKAIKSERLWGEEQKTAYWKKTDSIVRDWEAVLFDDAAQEFEKERRECLAQLGAAKAKALENKATPDWVSFGEACYSVINAARKRWLAMLIKTYTGVVLDRGQQLADTFGFAFDVTNVRAAEWFDTFVMTFGERAVSEISDTTREKISKLVQKAMLEGWGIDDMAKELSNYFTAAEEWRANLIARTETIRASNAGSNEIYKDWGVKEIEWIATRDNRVRNGENSPYNHLAADGEIVPLGQPFTKTGEALLYPGDPNGSAGNTIQCRCTTAPVME